MATLCFAHSPVPSSLSSSPSISNFISDHPCLTMLEKQCFAMKDLKKIHAHIIKTGLIDDPIAASRVLTFCASPSGDTNYAYLLFTRIPNPNLYSWNTIIRCFSRSSTPQDAISLFVEMLYSDTQPERLTYPSVFKAYAQMGLGHEGAQLHGRVLKLGLEHDGFIRNSLIHMYANSGLLSEARRVFHALLEFDVVAWNSMIMGLAKCREIEEARNLFDKMLTRTSFTWNSMISGYVRNGKLMEALELFHRMQKEGIEPSEFTMVSLLNACAHMGSLQQGKWIHDYVRKNGFELNVIVVTAIIDMYCKCGAIHDALQVFEECPRRGLSCWNSIIIGLAMNGLEREAIEFFSELESSSSLKPDYVSFIGALTACKHLGEVDQARDYFTLMMDKYKIKPSLKHYTCMVEVLGQAGLLEEAEELIKVMPIKADAIIWGSLLSSCRKHGNLEIAERAAKQVLALNPSDSGSYVLLSNVHAASSRFEEAVEERLLMKGSLTEKEPGCSLIEVNGETHEFLAGGRLHPKTQEIYSFIE
ncbi:pentatricopeptide repeat-containing protein At2g42920, chloroplastic-like [Neltuma alba]|uniref:pentatricopeptide repeat-containing protein At2g42920, chloroplastic-like n=1 Tax=Neltuma alba TaxID=207710 RepID=UPI0010A2F3A0|nr:pentatricopeptide repeat-containing protein At2g42920, chloroplastic-like [Prosopis alba]